MKTEDERDTFLIRRDTFLIRSPNSNSIRFFINGNEEILRMEANGDIFVRGVLTENDKSVVYGMREFLTGSMVPSGYDQMLQSRIEELQKENDSKRETIRLQMIQINDLQAEKERLEKENEELRGKK